MTAAPGPTTISPTPVSRLGPGSQAIAGSGVPTYKLLRYDEDYSYLKDPDRRTDFWDPIKYIPFGDREGLVRLLRRRVATAFPVLQQLRFRDDARAGTTPTSTSGTIFTAISTSVRTSASSASS